LANSCSYRCFST